MGLFKKKRASIILSRSPLAELFAKVVEENGCSYFYLFKTEMKDDKSTFKLLSACWIKNHVTVIDSYSPKNDMLRGLQPRIPTQYCEYEHDKDSLKAEQLEIVWGKEGVMVSLYENGELICAIPYWASEQFKGYSKYSCTSENPTMIPFPLGNPESNALFQRMEEAQVFWKQDFPLRWDSYKEFYLSELECKYGRHIKYYAIDGGAFPPKALAVFEKNGVKYVFTIGIGLFPQPKVDMHFEDYQNHELFELGFCYKANADFDDQSVFSQISSIAAIPWAFQTFLGHHHTVDLRINAKQNKAVLISDENIHAHESQFLREQNINLLWLMPIANDIYERIIAKPSNYSDIETQITADGVVYKNS